MQKKILSDQTLEELKLNEKKQKTILILYTLLLCIIIGVTLYITIENGIKLYIFLPIILMPLYIYSLNSFKKVKDEIKVREKHIFLQKRK